MASQCDCFVKIDVTSGVQWSRSMNNKSMRDTHPTGSLVSFHEKLPDPFLSLCMALTNCPVLSSGTPRGNRIERSVGCGCQSLSLASARDKMTMIQRDREEKREKPRSPRCDIIELQRTLLVTSPASVWCCRREMKLIFLMSVFSSWWFFSVTWCEHTDKCVTLNQVGLVFVSGNVLLFLVCLLLRLMTRTHFLSCGQNN